MAFRVCSLVSGSSGNAFLVESAEGLVLVDAGLSVKRLRELCRIRNVDPARLRAVVVTHDHSDHGRGAGVVHRAFNAPLAMTAGTWARLAPRAGRVAAPRIVGDGARLDVAGLRLHFHATPHDGREPCCVVVEAGGFRCGLLTDLGHPFKALGPLLATLDAVFLESNYNAGMLRDNREYPAELKARIRGKGGHLENRETGTLLRDFASDRLRAVVLSHLSEQNNDPALALAETLDAAGPDFARRGVPMGVAPRYAPSSFLVLG